MRWQHVAALGIWAIATSPSSASSRPDAEHSSDVAITHVSVIDVATGTSRVDQTVTIRGTRIVSVQPSRDTRLPPETRIVDATGKYLVPGLWDSHVHLSYLGACALPVFVANGVTALRDAGARLDEIREWRRQIAAGQLVGPLIKAAGPNIESADWLSRAYRLAPSSDPIWHWGPRVGVDGPGSARGVVDSLARLGVDFVKFRNLPRATFLAVAREAKRRGLPLAGHAPHGTSILEAADSGMASIEHAETVTLALDTASVSLRRRTFEELVKTGAFLTPTLITERANWLISDSAHRALIDDSTGTRDSDRKYVSARTIDLWREAMELNRKGDDGSTDWNELYRRQVADTRLADEAGVRFLAGTDVGGAIGLYAGTSLHDELRLMVRDAGVSPRRALESATTNPAAFFKLERERGTIAPGTAADLVLLDANPLADIDNVRRVRAVVLMGRVLQRADLDQLLAGVAAQVRARRGCAGSYGHGRMPAFSLVADSPPRSRFIPPPSTLIGGRRMSAERVAFITTWFEEIWNKGRLSAIEELLADDGVMHGLGEAGTDVTGPAAFRPFVERLRGAFPDIEVKVEQVVDDGELIAARWVVSMTHTGDHLGVPASGKRVNVTGMSMTRLRDGKLVEGWNNWDMLSLMQQVDAMQPAAQLLP